MNEKNLIPNSERTPEERREIARRGGIASGKARRMKRDIKQITKWILDDNRPLSDEEFNRLSELLKKR